MRATILFIIAFMLCQLSAHASTFVFKSGKKVEGTIRYEDTSTIRIMESSGLEMTLRKNELNLSATVEANTVETSLIALTETGKTGPAVNLPPQVKTQPPARVYTNRDVRIEHASFVPPEPQSSQGWQKSLAKLEREFVRLQSACRGAGTGPNLSKVLRSHTYNVNGKEVRVTGYWADPSNIEQAKQICERAIHTEEVLQQARRDFQHFLQDQKNQNNSLTAQ